MKLFKHIVTLLALITTMHAAAQVYPVQVTVATTPPYYNYLSHYGDQNNHLLIVATLTDFNSPPVNVRLRLKIEGTGYTLRTRQDVPVGNVYPLSPGVPVFIQGDELLPLLSEQNLSVVSGNPNLNNLPEGITSICVEVVENGTGGAILSSSNCTSFLLQLMQPPQPLLPVCNSVADTTSMFQTFQWSQPQNYIPGAGSELNYTFSLYEWIDTTNYNIFQTGQGLVYSAQTTVPLVQVSNFDVAFQKGRKYIWRVRAQITSNGLPTQMITQNGLSQPCSFYYGKPVSLQEALADGLSINLTTQALTTRKGKATWTVTDATPGQGLSTYSSYMVEYRKKTPEGSSVAYPWSVDTVTIQQLSIYQLEPGQTYQVRVAGMAGSYTSEPCTISEFTTPAARVYACGEADLPYTPANFQPLENAHMGNVVQIGQFPLYITQVTPLGTPGRYSGYGEIPHDFIGGAKVKVHFDNLLIDREYVVREGVANAMTDGAENWLQDQYLDHAYTDTVNGVIQSGGFVNDTTVFVIVNGDTLTYHFDLPYPVVIYGQGNIAYQFWPDGSIVITTWGFAPSNDQLDATKDLFVYFDESTQQQFGFDKKESDLFTPNYEVIVCKNQFIYFVSNKSKSRAGTDPVKAVIHGNIPDFQLSELQFVVAGGYTTIPFNQLNDSTFELNLPAKDFDYSVYAIYEDFKLGKINIKSYDQKSKKVVIVSLVGLDGFSEQQIESELNNIYKGANIQVDVTLKPQFNTTEFTTNTVFENPVATLMDKYTDQMRTLRNLYLFSNEIDNDEYLIFIVPGFENSELEGYMVRGKSLGFIKQKPASSGNQFIHNLAHELGHGIGGLNHPWEEQINLKGTTNNLLDYSTGTKLVKNQWESLRNSPLVLSLFDSEESGELNSALFELADTNLTTTTNLEIIQVLNADPQENFKVKFSNEKDIIFHFTEEQLNQISAIYLFETNVTFLGMRDGTIWHVCTNQVEKLNYNQQTEQYIILDRPTIVFYNPNSTRTKDTIISTENKTYYTFKQIDSDMLISINQTVNCTGTDSIIYISGIEYNTIKRNKIYCDAEDKQISGLAAYYFWIEENSISNIESPGHHAIVDQKVVQAFKKNNITLFNTNSFSYYANSTPADASLPTINEQKSIIAEQTLDGATNELFVTQTANELKSVIYYKREDDPTWTSIVREPVLYFEVVPLGNDQYKKTFIQSKNHIELPEHSINVLATSHFVVKKYMQLDGTSFDRYEIFDFSGNNVTNQFFSSEKNPPKRHLVFSNGYRGPGQNWDVSDNIVTSYDRYYYWGDIDNLFIERLRAAGKTWYIDGSERITTSNHGTMQQFGASMELIKTMPQVNAAPYLYNIYLNWIPNPAGFNKRKEEGRSAGKAFLAEIKKDPRSIGVKDTVDIVAHSMGYAYAVGFIEQIKNEVHFGRFYIFAPENACSGGNDWGMFEEVWQYGANNNVNDENVAGALTVNGTRDPHWWQDGIAPQCAVLDIEAVPIEKGGRVYIPKNFQPKSFTESHYIINYWWVFSQIHPGEKGYVKGR